MSSTTMMMMMMMMSLGSLISSVVGTLIAFQFGMFGGDGACRKTVCKPGSETEYEFRARDQNEEGVWTCPEDFEDTGCGWDNGDAIGGRQCQKKK
jgi:hypothetical protein